MQKLRTAFIAVLLSSAAAAACSDDSSSIAAPLSVNAAVNGTWTSTAWMKTDTGLQYIGTRSGLYRSAISGKTVIDSGSTVSLTSSEIAASKDRAETESALARINPSGGLAALHYGSSTTRSRPQLHNAQITNLGTKDGKRYALQQTFNGGTLAPPNATILTVDGQPVSVRSARYRKVGSRWQTTHTSTSLLDSTAATRIVVETDFGNAPTRVALAERMRSNLTVVGDALSSLILPTPLHAEVIDDDAAMPCKTEFDDQLKAAAAWSAAAAALAVATAACPETIASCFAIPYLAAALYVADVAVGVAIGNYVACMINLSRQQNQAGGGSSSSGGKSCVTIDWYVSYDGGHIWSYVDSTTTCGNDAEYMT